MPPLYSLRTDFTLLPMEEKTQFIRRYRKLRSEDLSKPATYGAAASKDKSERTKIQKDIGLTPEEIAVAKSLGLSHKDLKALKH